MGKHDLWSGYLGSFIRRHPHADVGDEAVLPPERYRDWLEAPVESSMAFMRHLQADLDQTPQPYVKNTELGL